MRGAVHALPWLAIIAVGYALVLVGVGAIPPVRANPISVGYFVGGWLALFLVAAVTAFISRRPVVWGAVMSGLLACAVYGGATIDQSTIAAQPLDTSGLREIQP